MRRLPSDFAELLSPRGRRLLDAPLPLEPRLTRARPFVALDGYVDRRRAGEVLEVLERAVRPALRRMDTPIPEWTTTAMVRNYSEVLPKAVRAWTAMLESRRAKAFRIAEEVGLVALLRSPSFHRFAQAVAGAPLKKGWGIQALCYGAGDYTGPHNDHHPEEPEAKDGYVDVHLTLANGAVAHQHLVYARDGHLSELQGVNTVGGITAYRLPFWHYTTPLVARPGRETDARRWVLLGTFLYDVSASPRVSSRSSSAASPGARTGAGRTRSSRRS